MKSFYRLYIFLLFLCIAIFLIVIFRQGMNTSDNAKSIPPVPKEITSTFQLYFVNKDKLAEEDRLVSTKDMLFEKAIVEELIKGPRNKTFRATIPPNTKLISIETIDKICYVNFSKEYIENKKWQELEECLIIWSLVNSLTQLDSVQKVQILVEGGKIDFKIDNVSLNQPFSRNEDIIQKSDVTHYTILKEFLDSLKMERFDRAYSMLDRESVMRISFQEFREIMSSYMKELRDCEIAFFNTQKFRDKIIISLKYVKDDVEGRIQFYQKWELIEVDGQIKIVFGDREDYINEINF